MNSCILRLHVENTRVGKGCAFLPLNTFLPSIAETNVAVCVVTLPP